MAAQTDPPDDMAPRNSSESPELPYLRREEREKRRVGQAIRECTDPFALEVHQSIDIPSTSLHPTLTALPAYVPRDHDRKLRHIVDEVIANTSRMALLVGGSSTGKTRACWEAVQVLPDYWRLWHPIDPSRPEAALADLRWVRPHTVIWLNEAQHYLLTSPSDLGERIAAGLRELLRDPHRGPVLVLGTIWPEYWARASTTPLPGEPDPHAQARALCEGNELPVPSFFAGRELAIMRETSASDPRLASAVQHAEHGQITQYLAGGQALLRRYRTAPDGARALIESAMDARRLGKGFALADDAQALRQAAQALETLGQHDEAVSLLLARPRANDSSVLLHAAEILERTGRLNEAATAYRHAAEAGNIYALRRTTALLQNAGRSDEALTWLWERVESGDIRAVRPGVSILLEAGRVDEAIIWYQLSAEVGDTRALWRVGNLLEQMGRKDERKRLWRYGWNPDGTIAAPWVAPAL